MSAMPTSPRSKMPRTLDSQGRRSLGVGALGGLLLGWRNPAQLAHRFIEVGLALLKVSTLPRAHVDAVAFDRGLATIADRS
eukprot:887871-Pyramimonas_sp.AAC.1